MQQTIVVMIALVSATQWPNLQAVPGGQVLGEYGELLFRYFQDRAIVHRTRPRVVICDSLIIGSVATADLRLIERYGLVDSITLDARCSWGVVGAEDPDTARYDMQLRSVRIAGDTATTVAIVRGVASGWQETVRQRRSPDNKWFVESITNSLISRSESRPLRRPQRSSQVTMSFESQSAIITNDSDLLAPVNLVVGRLRRKVSVLNPQRHPAFVLTKAASFFKQIRPAALAASQLPVELSDHAGSFTKPSRC